MDFYRDSVVKLESFKAGAFDWMMSASAKEWATEYAIPEVERGVIIRKVFPNENVAYMQGLAYNLRRPVFQDRRVRRALAYAFDFEWANRVLMYDAYTRCRSYFGASELEAAGLPEGRELERLRDLKARFPEDVPDEALTQEYHPPSMGEFRDERTHRLSVRRNLLEAKRILAEAGWRIRPEDQRLVNERFKDAAGNLEPMSFEILLVSPGFERIVLPFRLALRRLGIECRVRTVDSSVYQNRILDFDFDLTVYGWRMSESPGNEQTDYWSSKHADEKGSMNLPGIKNPAVDEAVRRLISSPTRSDLVTNTRVLDRLLQWGYYCIPNWYFSGDRIVYWDKFSHPPVTPAKGVTIMTWWTDEGKSRTLQDRRAALRKNR
jgi:microcin C transport system substrate-binding protein